METDFSTLIKTYRKSMGWTQEEMSEKWAYSFETISAWERKKRTPSSQEIPRLAKFLQMESEKLADIILSSKGQTNPNKPLPRYETRANWKAGLETWGELQHIYRTRTEFNKDFSYPRMFENAKKIQAAGISLNAIAMNYDRLLLKKDILENGCFVQACFLNPWGKCCVERAIEEGYSNPYFLSRLTDANLNIIVDFQKQIEAEDQEKSKNLEIRVYDMIPRFNIYVVDDTLMTVQGYAYGRGEETPTLVLRKQSEGGLFDYYASVVNHILSQSILVTDETMPREKRGDI